MFISSYSCTYRPDFCALAFDSYTTPLYVTSASLTHRYWEDILCLLARWKVAPTTTFISRMVTKSQPVHNFLRGLAILMFISSTFSALTEEQLRNSFNVQMDSNHGGSCDRDLPFTHEPMFSIILTAFDDAWLLSGSTLKMAPELINARSQDLDFTRLRALLFGFFGINLNSSGQFADDFSSQLAYDSFMGNLSDPFFDKSACRLTLWNEKDEFKEVDALLTQPSYHLEDLPKCWCLEDYAEFNEYMADDEGVEDPELGLAAAYFSQRGTRLWYLARMRQVAKNDLL